MTIDFKFTAEDFQEAAAARVAAPAGNGSGAVVSYVESENLLTLYTGDLTMQVVPKRGFTEPGSLERFCGLLQTYVPAGLFLPRPSAFSVIAPVPVLAPMQTALQRRTSGT